MNTIKPQSSAHSDADPLAAHDATPLTNHVHAPAPSSLRHQAMLTLGALGVVFGDIGTSPLYAMRETVLATGGTACRIPIAIMGALSLIFWTLMSVVTLKYVTFIMRADNNGEGGVLALATLAHRSPGLGAPDQDHDRRRRDPGAGAVLRRRHADARDHRAVARSRV